MIYNPGPATSTRAGLVSTGAQTWAGVKTLLVAPIISTLVATGMLFASATKEVVSTAAPTTGQVLIGVTSSNPVLTDTPGFAGVSINAAGATLTLQQAAGASSHFKHIATSASQYKIQGTNVSGASTIDIDPLDTAGTGACTFRFFRSTNTIGNVALQGFQGNATATFSFQLSGNTNIHSYVAAITNQLFAVGTSVPAAKFQVAGNVTAAAWGTNGLGIRINAATYTDSSSSGTVTNCIVHGIAVPTLAASSATTYSFSSTLYIAGPPTSGSNVTQSAPYSLWVDSGNCRFDGSLAVGGVTAPNAKVDISATTTCAIQLTGDGTNNGYIQLRGAEGTFGSFGLDYDGTLDATRLYGYSSSNVTIGHFTFNRGAYTSRLFINSSGLVGINKSSSIGAQCHIVAGSSTTIGQIVQLAASVSVDGWQMNNSSGVNLARFNKDGRLIFATTGTSDTSQGILWDNLQYSITTQAGPNYGLQITCGSNTTNFGQHSGPTTPVCTMTCGAAGVTALVVKAHASQSANTIEVNSSAGSGGNLFKVGLGGITTVGATTDSTSASTGALISLGGTVTTKNHLSLQGQGWGVTSTATAAGTTTLTSTSTVIQIFTGSTTQTIQFPAANLFGAGIAVIFIIINESSGDVTPTRAGSDTFVGGGTTFPVAGGATKKFMSNGVSKWSVQ